MRRLLLLFLWLIPVCAYGQPTDLLISEYVEGSSNTKAIEIYNGTGAAIDLADGDYVIQMYFNGNSSAGLTISLTGTVAAGDVYVVAHSSAVSAILDEADQTNGAGWFNGDDAVVLRRGGSGGTLLDAIGQAGNDPGSEWGSGSASTANNTLRRKSTSCSGDTDISDSFDPSADFDGFDTDTFDGLGAHTASCGGGDAAPSVAGTSPASGAAGVLPDADIVIEFSESVDVSGAWFSIVDGSNTAVAATVTGGPSEYTLNPASDLQEGETYTVTISAAQIADTDSDDPPDNMTEDYSFSFTVQSVVLISQIQGNGSTSPMEGDIVTVEAVVVGDFQENDGDQSDLDGFYIQEEAGDQDGDPATSEGIFVYAPGTANVQPGDVVRITAEVDEYVSSGSSLTELKNIASLSIVGSVSLPTPVELEMPFAGPDALERYEGMLVRLPQELVIAEYFNFDRFGEMVLARPLDGLERPFQPTSYVEPGTAAAQVAAEIALNRITLDDGRSSQNPDPALHPNGAEFTLNNRFRGGDILENVTGIVDERFGLYRIQPTQGADYSSTNPRTSEPEDVGGCLKVASFNVLNYFLTIDDGSDNCGPGADQECRGADTPEEFQRQRTKIIKALAEIGADVFGLIEMENTTGVEPLEDIVAGLNGMLGSGTYDYINTGTIGTDAIRVGIIYKPAAVTPVGSYAVLTSAVDPDFIDTKNRPTLAQTFRDNGSDSLFTVAVNHFKSKGSDCDDLGDPDLGDGQGNCNVTRTMAARALVNWLASDPTGSNDPDFLIIGDLNAYDQEDPIDAVRAGPDGTAGTADDYVDLIEHYQGEYAYSYVFDGQFGYLDYALASPSLAAQTTGAVEWHLNADEPDLLDYDMSFKQAAQDSLFEANPYRSSDHDPVVVGFDMNPLTLNVNTDPVQLWPPNHRYHTIDLSDLDLEVGDGCESELTSDDVVIAEAWSDEPENGWFDGWTWNDIVISDDCRSVDLRAERNGLGNGRVYTLKLQIADESGSTATACYQVKVPRNRLPWNQAVDNGPCYREAGCDPTGNVSKPVARGNPADEYAVSALVGMRSYPTDLNPSAVELELAADTDVRLSLFNASGEEVAKLVSGPIGTGSHQIPIPLSSLESGLYFIRLATPDAVETTTVRVVR